MLGRPHTVDTVRTSLAASTDAARLVWICTAGDDDVLDAVNATGDQVEVVEPRARGDYAAKINHGYRHTSEPWLFTGACDITFHPGWWEACLRVADSGAQVIGTNDLGNRHTATGVLSTHTLVARDYADQWGTITDPGQILHEGYWHEFTDNELIDTARSRGLYGHAADAIVEHHHPLWGKARPDGMYDRALLRMGQGHALWKRRKQLWAR